MLPVYVFDLDGTLADCRHRVPLIPDWDAFFAACGEDLPIWPVIKTAKRLTTSAEVWIVSGRNEQARNATAHWLERHGLDPEQVKFMRPHKDHRPDDEVKREWLHSLAPDDRARIVAVFDDRDCVVDMWRSEGLPCFQVAPGAF